MFRVIAASAKKDSILSLGASPGEKIPNLVIGQNVDVLSGLFFFFFFFFTCVCFMYIEIKLTWFWEFFVCNNIDDCLLDIIYQHFSLHSAFPELIDKNFLSLLIALERETHESHPLKSDASVRTRTRRSSISSRAGRRSIKLDDAELQEAKEASEQEWSPFHPRILLFARLCGLFHAPMKRQQAVLRACSVETALQESRVWRIPEEMPFLGSSALSFLLDLLLALIHEV